MSAEAAASFVQQWRAARPLRDLALRFLPADETGCRCCWRWSSSCSASCT